MKREYELLKNNTQKIFKSVYFLTTDVINGKVDTGKNIYTLYFSFLLCFNLHINGHQ